MEAVGAASDGGRRGGLRWRPHGWLLTEGIVAVSDGGRRGGLRQRPSGSLRPRPLGRPPTEAPFRHTQQSTHGLDGIVLHGASYRHWNDDRGCRERRHVTHGLCLYVVGVRIYMHVIQHVTSVQAFLISPRSRRRVCCSACAYRLFPCFESLALRSVQKYILWSLSSNCYAGPVRIVHRS